MKKNKNTIEYSQGGQILSALAGLVPGYGALLSPLIKTIDTSINQPFEQNQAPIAKLTTNPFGMKHGGFINDKFNQYRTGSHASQNDLTIDQNGNPDLTGERSVQNKENMVIIKGQPFVMSDTLTNPKTGNTFNVDAQNLNKKYKNARFNPDEKTALKLGMEMLAKLHNPQTLQTDKKEMSSGGNPRTYSTYSDAPAAFLPTLEQKYRVPDIRQYANPVIPNTPPQTQTTQFTGLSDSDIMNGVALGLKGLALGRSLFDAVQSPEREKIIKPDYNASDRYLKEATIDYSQAKQDALGISNISGNLNRNNSSGYAQMLGREAARIGTLGDQVSNINQAQTNANSQLNLTKAQVEQQRAVDLANRQYQNRIDNQANQANQRGFQRDLFGDLSKVGSEFNRYAETKRMIQNQKDIQAFNNNQMVSFLNAKYPNFGINSDIMDKLQKGVITIDDFLSYLPSNIKQDLKQNGY